MKLISEKMAVAKTDGFTLVELVVVICLAIMLTLVVFPAMATSKPGSSVAQCLNSKRQLSIGWQMYANDNSDSLMPSSWIGIGSVLDWSSREGNTNTAYLIDPSQALMGTYNRNAALFKCPSDNYQSAANLGPRDRSISCNSALMGNVTVQGTYPNNTIYLRNIKKIMDLAKPGPAKIFLFADEHPDSINDGFLAVDPGYTPVGEHWRDLPASYHNGGTGISFTDGHCELHQWVEKGASTTAQTIYPVLIKNYASGAPWVTRVNFFNLDYEWMEGSMPCH